MTDNSKTTPQVLSVPNAGRTYLNLGRNASYEAARRGDIPTIKIGRKLVVPIRAMEKLLDNVGAPQNPLNSTTTQ